MVIHGDDAQPLDPWGGAAGIARKGTSRPQSLQTSITHGILRRWGCFCPSVLAEATSERASALRNANGYSRQYNCKHWTYRLDQRSGSGPSLSFRLIYLPSDLGRLTRSRHYGRPVTSNVAQQLFKVDPRLSIASRTTRSEKATASMTRKTTSEIALCPDRIMSHP